MTTDAAVVRNVLSGRPGEFRALVEKYQRAVAAIAYRKLSRQSEIEDVVQETFTRAYEKLGTLSEPDKFAGWLYQIASNLSENVKRRARRETPVDDTAALERVFMPDNPVEEEEERNRLHLQVRRALAALPDDYGAILSLRYGANMDYEDIARQLKISVGAAQVRVSRALDMVRKTLKKADYNGMQ